MRILLLSTYFEPDVASTGVLMTLLSKELVKRDHSVTVLTSMPHYSENRIWKDYRGRLVKSQRQNRLKVHHLFLYVPGKKTSFLGRLMNYASFNFLAGIAGLLVGHHDVILVPSPPLTNGITADVLARIWQIPFVYNVQDIWPDVVIRAGLLTSARSIRYSKRLEKYVYQRADSLSVISEDFRQNLIQKGVDPQKIEVIPNFFDTDFIRPLPRSNEFRERLGLSSEFIVMFAGNIGVSQGLEVVLQAAGILQKTSDIVILIVGNGREKERLHKLAKDMALSNVRFLPFQPHQDLPLMYAASDVCLVPLRRGFTNESVPCKVFSIMSAARPLIASVDPGSDTWKLVNDTGCGVCIDLENAEALADAVLNLYSDRTFAEIMGKRGRDHVVRKFTPSVVVEEYERLLKNTIDAF
jgi:colanic acid biosynthesis glycosyl transferase WcaI